MVAEEVLESAPVQSGLYLLLKQKRNLLEQLQQLLLLLYSKQHGHVPSSSLRGHDACDVGQLPVDQALEPQEKKLVVWKGVKRE